MPSLRIQSGADFRRRSDVNGTLLTAMSRTKDTIEADERNVEIATPQSKAPQIIDVSECAALLVRLAIASPEKYDEIVGALRQIVDHAETLASFDWQLLFGVRPSSCKRYQA